MPDQTIRFTPEELEALEKSGQWDIELVRAMHPDDRKVFSSIWSKNHVPESDFSAAAKVVPATAAAAALGAVLPEAAAGTAAGRVLTAGKFAGRTVGTGLMLGGANYGMKALGLPRELADLITMGMAFSRSGEPMGAPKPTSKPTVIPPTNMSRGRTMDPLQASPGGEIFERVTGRGVQNDFRGPVAIRRSPLDVEKEVFGSAPQGAYSPNISTGAGMDDIIEMITRSSSKGSPSPLKVHGDKALEAAIRGIKNLKYPK